MRLDHLCADKTASAKYEVKCFYNHVKYSTARTINSLYLRLIGPKVFVLGNQKSGTSAISALLGMMTNSSVAIDFSTDRVSAVQLVRMRKLSVQALFELDIDRIKACSVLKEPHLTFLYEDLRLSYPRAQFVFVVRDPADNIRSICDRLRIETKDLLSPIFTFNLSATFKPNPGWELVFYDETLYPEHFYSLCVLELLAHRWKMAAQVYLSNRESMELVRYEDFLKDKEATITNLVNSLGMTPRRSIRAQMDKQFQPRGGRHLSITQRHRAIISKIASREMRLLGYYWCGDSSYEA